MSNILKLILAQRVQGTKASFETSSETEEPVLLKSFSPYKFEELEIIFKKEYLLPGKHVMKHD